MFCLQVVVQALLAGSGDARIEELGPLEQQGRYRLALIRFLVDGGGDGGDMGVLSLTVRLLVPSHLKVALLVEIRLLL